MGQKVPGQTGKEMWWARERPGHFETKTGGAGKGRRSDIVDDEQRGPYENYCFDRGRPRDTSRTARPSGNGGVDSRSARAVGGPQAINFSMSTAVPATTQKRRNPTGRIAEPASVEKVARNSVMERSR